jgi:O6-methylguanine-DNA--protein-cysteine methyltransferase
MSETLPLLIDRVDTPIGEVWRALRNIPCGTTVSYTKPAEHSRSRRMLFAETAGVHTP